MHLQSVVFAVKAAQCACPLPTETWRAAIDDVASWLRQVIRAVSASSPERPRNRGRSEHARLMPLVLEFHAHNELATAAHTTHIIPRHLAHHVARPWLLAGGS
jgi:hypothetical protein